MKTRTMYMLFAALFISMFLLLIAAGVNILHALAVSVPEIPVVFAKYVSVAAWFSLIGLMVQEVRKRRCAIDLALIAIFMGLICVWAIFSEKQMPPIIVAANAMVATILAGSAMHKMFELGHMDTDG